MTEVPEHLLKRASEARARMTGEAPAGEAGAAPAAAPSTAPVPAAAASTPAIPEPPAPPAPVAPYVQAALRRKTIPVWVIPVLLFLPIWAIYYVGYLENPPAEPTGLAYEGGEVYAAQCAGCHGAGGGGGSGRQLNGGEVLLTFPSLEAGASYDGLAGMIHWIANGTQGTVDAGMLNYGDPDRPGGARVPGSFGGQMAAFGGNLNAEELLAVAYHERSTFGDAGDEAGAAELALLDELVHLTEEEGVTSFADASLEEIQSWVDMARAQLGEGGNEMAAG